MRSLPLATVAALTILTAAASAQTPSPSSPHPMTPPTAGTTTTATPAINPLSQEDISKIDGKDVYGTDNSKIGHISTALMSPDTRKVDRLVVAAGGVLGVGSHRVAIPLDKFSWDAHQNGFKLSMTENQLKSMPEWAEGSNGESAGSSIPSPSPGTTERTHTTH